MPNFATGPLYPSPGRASIVRGGAALQLADTDLHLYPEAGPGRGWHFPAPFTQIQGGAVQSFVGGHTYVLTPHQIATLQAAGAGIQAVDTTATASTTATAITLPSNPGTLVRVTNNGTAAVYVAVSGTATVASPTVPAGASALFDLPSPATNTISALAASGTVNLIVARGLGASHIS